MINPSKERIAVYSFINPSQDVLFWELVDTKFERTRQAQYGSPHWDTRTYPNHILVHIEPASDSGGAHRFWYYLQPENQDAYNWEFTTADIGGTKFDAVQRTYLFKRDAISSTSPAMGAAMPNVPTNKFSSGYVLAERKENRTHKILDGLFVLEVRTYVKKHTIKRIGSDQMNGKPLSHTSDLYYRGETITINDVPIAIEDLVDDTENAYWGIQSTGHVRTVQQLSTNWWLIESEQVVAVGEGGLVSSYSTNDNYSFPAVLRSVDFLNWERRPEDTYDLTFDPEAYDTFPYLYFNPEGYSGPCKTDVEIYWSKDAVAHADVTVLIPESIDYASPLFRINTGPCLHNGAWFKCDIGNSHPIYKLNTGSRRDYPATDPTDWPTEPFLAFWDQVPYKGGFLITKRTITPPEIDRNKTVTAPD